VKIVVDANVFVSAAIAKGAPHDLIMRWLRGADYEILLCPLLVEEIESVLVIRESLRRYIPREEAETFVVMIATFGSLLPNPLSVVPESRDQRDDYLIHFARKNNAELIVSGDRDLLEWLDQSPPVVTPRTFLERADTNQK
jgi:putative PIN family toxin of toxin-antitoxin system